MNDKQRGRKRGFECASIQLGIGMVKTRTAETRSGEGQTAEHGPGENRTAETRSGENRTAETQTVETRTAETATGGV
jgi:hypothetical protein